MAKPTKGPWRVSDPEKPLRVYGPAGVLVAEVNPYPGTDEPGPAEANARLMAAAPALLAAAETALAVLDYRANTGDEAAAEAWGPLDDAVREAKGEQR